MTIAQKRKILKKIVTLESDIGKLDKIRMSLISNEFQSATISINGGSKSYTRQDVSKLTETLKQMKEELMNTRCLLNGTSPAIPAQIYTVYS